jgi:hypothetical protein
MREPEDKVTVVNTDGGGGAAGGVIAGVLIAVAAIAVALFLFGGDIFGNQSRNVDVTIDTPDISVDAPEVAQPAE